MSELLDIQAVITRLLRQDRILLLCHKKPGRRHAGQCGRTVSRFEKFGKNRGGSVFR